MKILLIILLISSGASAQHNGFFGKKNYIEINTLSYSPIINNLFSSGNTPYKSIGSTLRAERDWFESGLRIAIGHSVKNNFGFGLELGMDFQNIAAPRGNYYDYEYDVNYISKHEILSVRTIAIMPKVEFTNADGLLPIGLNHQIGIGYSSSKVVDKDYVIIREQSTTPGLEDIDLAPISDGFKGFTLLYAMNMRTALSKHFMINYGFRYTLNVVLVGSESFIVRSGYQVSRRELGQAIRRRRLHNGLTFNFGFSIPF